MKQDDLRNMAEFEALQNEQPPADLENRIMRRLTACPAVKPLRRLSFATAGLAAAFAVGIVFVSTRPAVADDISDVRRAFLGADDFEIRTYRVASGRRTQVSETHFRGGAISIRFIDPQSNSLEKEPQVEAVSQQLSESISKEDLATISQPGALQKMLQSSSTDAAGFYPGKSLGISLNPQGINIKKLAAQVDELSQRLDVLKLQLRRLEAVSNDGAGVVGGSAGAEYTRRMLSKDEFWVKRPDEVVDGKRLGHFEIREGLQHLDLFVDQVTGLPVRVRFDLTLNGQKVTVEDEYVFPTH